MCREEEVVAVKTRRWASLGSRYVPVRPYWISQTGRSGVVVKRCGWRRNGSAVGWGFFIGNVSRANQSTCANLKTTNQDH